MKYWKCENCKAEKVTEDNIVVAYPCGCGGYFKEILACESREFGKKLKPIMNCSKCGTSFPESELQLSHDIPRYMGGLDIDGRHYLCKACHIKYELEVIKISFMNLFKLFPEEWKKSCLSSARLVKSFYFKEDKND
jgi:predicted nucleic-acid-binding Zn-ribbon protein